ncbi:MAG: sensor domain-containing diguanylate cyclase [Candidatus Aceula meridiana]|nr:sensor domain-containing diguanylate cyclase [Candidatus Aceula meridiana]
MAIKNNNKEYERLRLIFENSPIGIWEEDVSCFAKLLEQLKKQEVINYRKYLLKNSQLVECAFKGIKVLDVNKAALNLYGAKTKKELLQRFGKTLTKNDILVLIDEFVALTSGDKIFEKEFKTQGADRKRYELWLRVAVLDEDEEALSRIIVTIEDITRRKKKENYLKRVAREDSLTGLLNHKSITNRFDEEFSRCRRYNEPMACLMIDIDYFKPINDNFGHQIGDKMLKQVAIFLKKLLRTTDLIGRYGGDEFLVILGGTEKEGAHVAAERIRESVFGKKFKLTPKVIISNTLSIGVTSYPINKAKTTKDFIHLADKALYQAKADGRNCVRALQE